MIHYLTDMNRRNALRVGLTLALSGILATGVQAQLSKNKDKFLGNITTGGSVDYGNEKFYTLWNQITPENESKWSSIEGTRGSFNWGGCDNAYNYAKNHGFPFKFHTLVWGSQYPSWMDNLSTEDQYKEIIKWLDAIKARYPNLEMIDVVNEAVTGHAPAPYRAALGGEGKTGYDWIIKAFELAYERWPNAILIYNDYNTFQWQKTQFIDLVRTLRDAGAPIDAYGCQSHDVTDMSLSNFKAAMDEIQSALKMPMYSTEYDIGTTDDALQLQRYKEQIPYMWEKDYCAGITLWGYIYGRTWTTDGNSGIIKDGKDRPAMTWLREYMKSEDAQNAKSPFPGMKKEASVYIKPHAINVTKGDSVLITIRAKMRTKKIDHIDFYVKNKLYTTLTEAPYEVKYLPTTTGKYDLKAVVVTTDTVTYERLSSFTANNPRSAYKTTTLPGTLQAENFDKGGEGVSYHDSDSQDEGGANYRSDNGGVDIVTGNGGYAIGYTSSGEWLEYTVDVQEEGMYEFTAYASSGVTNSSFSLSLSDDNGLTALTNSLTVPCAKENSWDTYKTITGRLLIPLKAGKQIIRLNITGSSCNVDKIVFSHIVVDDKMKVSISTNPTQATVNTNTTIKVDVTPSSDTVEIKNVKVYLNGAILKTMSAAPYEFVYKPTAKGTYTLTAIATDSEGRQSKIASYSMTVYNQRVAYKGVVSLPGTFQAENFDKGGEGFTFHDKDSEDEGGTKYRTDNEGVDIVTGNGGYALGYTAVDDWTEYSVKITEAGTYRYEATVSSGVTGSGFTISYVKDGKVTKLATVSVPQTGSNSWDTYKTVSGGISKTLEEGEYIIRLTITGQNCNIDKIKFTCTIPAGVETISESEESDDAMYNTFGQKIDADYKGVIIEKGKKRLVR